MKESWKPGTLIYPLPAVLVSCGATPEEYNLLTVAWTGTVCTNPPMCYISVRPERHSYEIIRRTGEFVINLTTRDLARAADWCGVRSGRDYDKFREMGLTPGRPCRSRRRSSKRRREHRVPRAAGDAPRFARYVSGRGGRRAGRCRLYRPCYGAFLPRTRLPDRLLPRRIFRPGRGHRPLRLVGAQEAAPDGGRRPRSPRICCGEYPGCGSFRSTRGRPREREARRKTCPCAKTRSSCRPPLSPQTRREEAAALMPGAGLSGDSGHKKSLRSQVSVARAMPFMNSDPIK